MSFDLNFDALRQLQSVEHSELFAAIDKLSDIDLSIGQSVLPRLVVVGDRGAGKSSALETITHIRFPAQVGEHGCTRFATELVLRASPETMISAQLRSQSGSHIERSSNFYRSDLISIIREARQRLGLFLEFINFSEDVLRVEISAPNLPCLTLVDLPGLYEGETNCNASMTGAAAVNRIADEYMSQEDSIIVVVVPAEDVRSAPPRALEKARQHDPSGRRTLGIITKPDKAEESYRQEFCLHVLRNEEKGYQLAPALGWHVLRNLSEEEIRLSNRERARVEESPFITGLWSLVGQQHRGIKTLREKLGRVMLSHVQSKLPGLITKIKSYICNNQCFFEQLGDPLSSPMEVRKYLIGISNKFQRLALHAVQGNYTDDFFGGLFHNPAADTYTDWRIRKLRSLVRDLNSAFYHVLLTRGETRRILWTTATTGSHSKPNEPEKFPESFPEYLQPFVSLFVLDDPSSVTIGGLKQELEAIGLENQGVEFPRSSNNRLALQLFRDHSQPWESIALQHVETVAEFSKDFVMSLLSHIVDPDFGTVMRLFRHYVNPYFEQKKVELADKVLELLQHLRSGYDPQPISSEFLPTRRRADRLTHQVLRNLNKDHPDNFMAIPTRKLDEEHIALAVAKSFVEFEDGYGTEEIIDTMTEYYEVRTFTVDVNPNARLTIFLRRCPSRTSPTMS